MDTIGYLVLGYMVFGIILALIAMYLSIKLLGYVYKQYPEESSVIRSYEWQRYPCSMFYKTLKALINKYSISDAELAQRAKRSRSSAIFFWAWFVLGLVMFFTRVLFLLAK